MKGDYFKKGGSKGTISRITRSKYGLIFGIRRSKWTILRIKWLIRTILRIKWLIRTILRIKSLGKKIVTIAHVKHCRKFLDL